MSNDKLASDVRLTRKEHAQNALRALTKLIPYAGDSLDQLSFGVLDELRQKRVEATLNEVLLRLKAQSTSPAQSEEFAALFERTAPKIARATSEDVRQRFRDLLVSAAPIPTGDERWGEAVLAEQILSEMDAAPLAILAQLARYSGRPLIAVVSRPQPQVVSDEDFSWDAPLLGEYPIGYAWAVVEEWMRRLREKRLISFSSHDQRRGGFGSVHLTDLGEMLVKWAVAEPIKPSSAVSESHD